MLATLATVAAHLRAKAIPVRSKRRRVTVDDVVAASLRPVAMTADELARSTNSMQATRELIKLQLLSRAIDGCTFSRAALAAHAV